MKEKEKTIRETGEIVKMKPRPKWHYWFILKESNTDGDLLNYTARKIKTWCPEFDENALDATSRFFYGYTSTEAIVEIHDGDLDIIDFFKAHPEVEPYESNAPANQLRKPDGTIMTLDDIEAGNWSGGEIPLGSIHNTLRSIALKALTRYGDEDGAKKVAAIYKAAAEHTEVKIPAKELERCWNDALNYYRTKIKTKEDYKSPADFERELNGAVDDLIESWENPPTPPTSPVIDLPEPEVPDEIRRRDWFYLNEKEDADIWNTVALAATDSLMKVLGKSPDDVLYWYVQNEIKVERIRKFLSDTDAKYVEITAINPATNVRGKVTQYLGSL